MFLPAALLIAASLAPSPETAPATASGKFVDQKWTVPITGAYAFRSKTGGFGDDDVIRVAVSNTKFVPEAVDWHFDREHAINTYFVDDETKVVYFEFEESGKYHGLSYYFESGDGCGYCFDSKVKSTVRASEGRLKGDLSYKGDDREFQITLDVPITRETPRSAEECGGPLMPLWEHTPYEPSGASALEYGATKDALRALAAQAVTKGTGARALRSMLERIMLDIMYDVPSREDIAEVTINRAVVEGKKLPLIRKKQDKSAA